AHLVDEFRGGMSAQVLRGTAPGAQVLVEAAGNIGGDAGIEGPPRSADEIEMPGPGRGWRAGTCITHASVGAAAVLLGSECPWSVADTLTCGPGLRGQAEDLEKHLLAHLCRVAGGIILWRNLHQIPANDIQSAQPSQQLEGVRRADAEIGRAHV